MNKTFKIEYSFSFADGKGWEIDLELDAESLEQVDNDQQDFPDWTRLDYCKCPNCPLDIKTSPHCPVAINLVKLLGLCSDMQSYDETNVTVTTPERTIIGTTTIQRAISSLLGLFVATSPCPHTEYFKPMARFHLPLSSEDETIYRATSMYLLAQYFLYKKGKKEDLSLDGLSQIYRNLQVVNVALADRLRSASSQDAAVNAVVLLDLLAKALPYSIEDSLEEIEFLFAPFFRAVI